MVAVNVAFCLVFTIKGSHDLTRYLHKPGFEGYAAEIITLAFCMELSILCMLFRLQPSSSQSVYSDLLKYSSELLNQSECIEL